MTKTDHEFATAWVKGKKEEWRTAEELRRRFGLDVVCPTPEFRDSIADIDKWNHDIDMWIDGDPYQHKVSERYAWGQRSSPIVDEKLKADRTPVKAYIVRFNCGTLRVVRYNPSAWRVWTAEDRKDHATKDFYVAPLRFFLTPEDWFFGQAELFMEAW